jgi:hypothetical protein
MVKFPEVTVKLTGRDGNAFAIIGAVVKAMRETKVSNPGSDYTYALAQEKFITHTDISEFDYDPEKKILTFRGLFNALRKDTLYVTLAIKGRETTKYFAIKETTKHFGRSYIYTSECGEFTAIIRKGMW